MSRKVYECISLLSSMVSGGESHSKTSRNVIAEAQAEYESLETKLAEKEAEIERLQFELKQSQAKESHFAYIDFVETHYVRRDVHNLKVKQNNELRKENERQKNNEQGLINILSDWYYASNGDVKCDEKLREAFENFLTFGQGGANFLESQLMSLQAEIERLKALPKEIWRETQESSKRWQGGWVKISDIEEIFQEHEISLDEKGAK